jgi:hypothetical protein
VIDLKEWYRGMPPDFRQYLKTRYQTIRAELETDPNLDAEFKLFLLDWLSKCSSQLRQVRIEEEAEK